MSFDNMVLKLESKLEKHGDFFLPYAVKDIRQTIRSKAYLGLFFLGFFVATFLSFWYSLVGYNLDQDGFFIFFVFNTIVDIGVLIVLPILTAVAMNQERNSDSFELQQVTSSTPLKIVMGKWQSGMVQVFLFFFMILPFVSYSYILGKVTILDIVFFSVASLFYSQFLVCLAVFSVSVCKNKRARQAFSSLIGLFVIYFGLMTISWKFSFTFWKSVDALFSDPDSLYPMLSFVVFLLLAECFFISVSVGQLSSYSANKSSWPKFFLSLISLEVFILFFVNTGEAGVFLAFSYIGILLIGPFFLLEDDSLSKRQKMHLDNAPKVFRFIKNFFYPGRSSAIIWLLSVLTVLSVSYVNISGVYNNSRLSEFVFVWKCLIAYLCTFYFINIFLQKNLRNNNLVLAYIIPVVFILLVFVGMPYFFSWEDDSIVHFFNITNFPFHDGSGHMTMDSIYLSIADFFAGVFLFAGTYVYARICMKREVRMVRHYEAGERGSD